MLRNLERFKQNPLRVQVTERSFDEVTDPQPKTKVYNRIKFITGLLWV